MLVQSSNLTLEMFGTPNTGCAAVIAVQVEDFTNSETRHLLQPPLSSDTPCASTREAPDFSGRVRVNGVELPQVNRETSG